MENTPENWKHGAGRPRTGGSSYAISIRLPIEVLEVYRLRAEKDGYASVNAYLQNYLSHEALRNRHPSRLPATPPV